ncbi:hypothetical protein CRE_00888 [Caenorhabditis remanei]|uniref:Fibronectin type-III domain-containing protein n=1 Tax=Caenorhabditis remanei TaxID=31234 RepID=E3LEX6_CAERE|nr:hypothetical protein CRE_00888 [Caenorhabditis remanei]
MYHTVLLALLLAFCATANAVDSEGTDFVFGFVRNANSDITNQVLSITVLNQNAQDCSFTLTFRPDYHKTTPPQNMTQTVASMKAQDFPVPSWYGWDYAGQNVQNDVFLTLMGYSTCAVTVLANNFDNVTGQGDTYMVLPTRWGSKSFTFSLPPAVISTQQHYEQLYVLPTTDGATQVRVAEIGNTQSEFTFNVTYGNAPAVYIGTRTPDKRPRTYHITSDKDVLIVAGVTCAGADVNSCDHVAYMPHPPPASDCYAYDYYDDDHMSYLPTTAQYFADIPGSCTVGQNITATLNDGSWQTITIIPKMESPLWTIQTTNAAQLGVAFHNGGSNIHIARYYDGSKFSSMGGYIATSPSVTQYHADSTAFYTKNANDSVEIYCTVLSCASISIDGVQIKITDTQVVQSVDGVSYYMFVITLANSGFHQINLKQQGQYSFFVYGKNKQYSYGYEGGANKPTFVLAPATTTTKGPTTPTVSTLSTLTPPSTVTTQTPPTTASPPATQSTASPTTPGTSKQTTVTVPAQTTPTVPIITISTTQAPPASVTTAAITTSTLPPQSSASTLTPSPTPSHAPGTQSAATTATQSVVTTTNTPPVVTTSSVQPVVTTSTLPPLITTATAKPVVTTTVVTQPLVTTNSVTPAPSTATPTTTVTVPTNPPVTSYSVTTQTVPTVTTATPPQTPGPTTVTTPSTAAPSPTTVTTGTVVTTPTTKIPIVTTQTTPSPAPQTSSPTTPTTVVNPVTTASPSTGKLSLGFQIIAMYAYFVFAFFLAGTTVTTTAPPVTVTTPTTAPTVTTPTTTTPTTTKPTTTVKTTLTTVTTPTTVTTTKPTQAAVTTPTTAPVTTTTKKTTTTPTTTTSTTTTTVATTTKFSSVISLATPVVITVLFSLF